MSGTLIAILRLTGAAVAGLPAFSTPFLLAVAAAAFLLLAVVAEILVLRTFLVAPLVDILVAVFLAGFPLLAGVAAFFPAAPFCGAFLLPRFAVVTVFRDAAAGFFAGCLAGFFLLTLPFAALLFLLAALGEAFFGPLPAALGEAFFGPLPAAFLLTDFFRATMLSVLAFALESGVCKTADYT